MTKKLIVGCLGAVVVVIVGCVVLVGACVVSFQQADADAREQVEILVDLWNRDEFDELIERSVYDSERPQFRLVRLWRQSVGPVLSMGATTRLSSGSSFDGQTVELDLTLETEGGPKSATFGFVVRDDGWFWQTLLIDERGYWTEGDEFKAQIDFASFPAPPSTPPAAEASAEGDSPDG